jgi:hypothetical protein
VRGNCSVPARLSRVFCIGGEQVEDEAFYDATSIAAMRIGCLPGNARNAGRDGGNGRKHAGGQKDVGWWESLGQQKPAERPRGDAAQPF